MKTKKYFFYTLLTIVSLSFILLPEGVLAQETDKATVTEGGEHVLAEGRPPVIAGPLQCNLPVEEQHKLYDVWTKPGLPYPWDIPVEERDKLSAQEIFTRWQWGVQYFAFLREEELGYGDFFVRIGVGTMDGRDLTRYKTARELRRGWVGWPDHEGNTDINFKYLVLVDTPEDVRGLGSLVIGYMDPEKPDDEWLYLPSLRKIRRMPAANKQDAFLGSVIHQDDVNCKVESYSYELISTKKLERPDPTIAPWSDWCMTRRLTGVGEDCYVIEMVPKQRWYFTKGEVWINKKSFQLHWMKKYDKKGRFFKTWGCGFVPGLEIQKQLGKRVVDGDLKEYWMWYTSGTSTSHDMRTGAYSWFLAGYSILNQGYPEEYFTERALVHPYTVQK